MSCSSWHFDNSHAAAGGSIAWVYELVGKAWEGECEGVMGENNRMVSSDLAPTK